MQPIVPNSVSGYTGEPAAGSVVSSSDAGSSTQRGHFVFGLFQQAPKADEAVRILRSADFRDDQMLLIRGPAHDRIMDALDGAAPLPDSVLAANTPFAPLINLLQSYGDGHARSAVLPRVAHQISDNLAQGGSVLIVAIRTSAEERLAARTCLTCKCDVLLTHEVATKL
jgi:hypothetical protein